MFLSVDVLAAMSNGKKQDVEGRTIVTRNLITLLSFQVEEFPRSFCVGMNLSVCSGQCAKEADRQNILEAAWI